MSRDQLERRKSDRLKTPHDYIEAGYCFLPVSKNGKAPYSESGREWPLDTHGWPHKSVDRPITTEDLALFPEINNALHLGPSGLIDIDCDDDEGFVARIARCLTARLQPGRFGREGSLREHIVFKRKGDAEPNYMHIPDWVELRGDAGRYTVFPNSSKEGVPIRWRHLPDEFPELTATEAEQLTNEIIAASILLKHWKKGQRDKLTVTAFGVMLRGTYRDRSDDADELIAAVAGEAADDELTKRRKAKRVSEAIARGDAHVYGYPTLVELIGVKDAELFAQAVGFVETYPCTDAGNSKRLLREFGEDVLFVSKLGEKQGWHYWNDIYWESDSPDLMLHKAMEYLPRAIYAEGSNQLDDATRKETLKWARATGNVNRLKGARELFRCENRITTKAEQLDTNPWLLCCANGVVDLETGEFRPGKRSDYITKCTGVAFDPSAECPTWDRFLREVLPDELVHFMHKVFGYALTGKANEQCIVFPWGGGANGKSTMLMAVKNILGDYAVQTDPKAFMVKRGDQTNDIARLRGARLVLGVETEQGQQLNESLVKQLTGGDTQTARFLYGEFFEFVPQFTPIIATNYKPVITGTDDAIWRRIRLVPFQRKFAEHEQDLQLEDKLRAEYPGILNWLIEGCHLWQREGLGSPDKVKSATAEYRSEQDPLSQWIEECAVLGANCSWKASELQRDYLAWCDRNNVDPKTRHNHLTLKPALADKGIEHKKQRSGMHYLGIGKRDERYVDEDGDDVEY